MALKKGDKAPSFKLFNSEKKEVSSEDFKGKNLIIHFFPAAFTGVCTTQLCTMRDDLSFYTKLNAEVIGISVDSVFTLGKFKEEQKYNFNLLSDFNKEVSKAYGTLYDGFVFGMKGVSQRAAFVIDKDGIIQYAEITESVGVLPKFDEIKKALSAI